MFRKVADTPISDEVSEADLGDDLLHRRLGQRAEGLFGFGWRVRDEARM